VVEGETEAGIHYEVSGRGEPVVLLHGFSLDRRMWEPQVAELEREHRVLRVDLRGHGRSAAIRDSFAAYEDLASVLDAAGVERAALVGLSSGASIAVDFALVHPERVTRLVLASPGLGGYVPVGSFEWMAPVGEALRAGDVAGAVERWAETPLMSIPSRSAGDSLMRKIVAENAGIWSVVANPERPLSPPAIRRLEEIGVPVLVIVGERDLVDTHAVADTLVARIGGAQKAVIPGAGHMVNLAEPAAFNERLLPFLGR
jgi:pimeloyl-ACP methyl ester carboxylesterase